MNDEQEKYVADTVLDVLEVLREKGIIKSIAWYDRRIGKAKDRRKNHQGLRASDRLKEK